MYPAVLALELDGIESVGQFGTVQRDVFRLIAGARDYLVYDLALGIGFLSDVRRDGRDVYVVGLLGWLVYSNGRV